MRQQSNGAINLFLVLGILVIAAGVAWWFLREPPLQPNELRVTYQHNEVCRWQDWSFRIRREVQKNRVSMGGSALSVGRPNIQQKDDQWLRVYSSAGGKLNIDPASLRLMRFITRQTSGSSNQTVLDLEVVTDTGTLRFKPVPLPKFSRSRIMVPLASHYFPDQSDDYMQWGNVRMTLAGTPNPECSVDREISLTRPDHSAKRTPVMIEFGY